MLIRGRFRLEICAWFIGSAAHQFRTSPSALLKKEVAVSKSEVKKCASAIHDRRLL